MTQPQLLNTALQHLLDNGADTAYSFIEKHFAQCSEPYDALIYQLRCTLAIQSGHIEEGLKIMNEAVMEIELWFRPEFFDDETLAPVWKTETYKLCRHKSDRLYTEARQKAKTFCTWDRVRDVRIMLALHGNGQNISDSREMWKFAEDLGWQTEYIQSKELDSVGRYRWSDNSSAPSQLEAICGNIGWHDYEERALAGFSTGCNVILRAINRGMLECEKLFLVSPIIPILSSDEDNLYKMLISAGPELTVFCCKGDEESGAFASRLVKGAMERGITARLIEGEGIGVPAHLEQLAKQYME